MPVEAEYRQLDKDVREGVPTSGWPGDPRLSVQLGVVTAGRSGYSEQKKKYVRKGDVVARRLEVWRHNEDGTDAIVGTWSMDEVMQVISDLVVMDPGRPRHVGVEDRIDTHNAALEAAAAKAYQEVNSEMIEHALRLDHDRNNPINIFRGMPGTRDRTDLKR